MSKSSKSLKMNRNHVKADILRREIEELHHAALTIVGQRAMSLSDKIRRKNAELAQIEAVIGHKPTHYSTKFHQKFYTKHFMQ